MTPPEPSNVLPSDGYRHIPAGLRPDDASLREPLEAVVSPPFPSQAFLAAIEGVRPEPRGPCPSEPFPEGAGPL